MVRIFLDACIVIDLVEARPEQQELLKILIIGKELFGSDLASYRLRA